MELEEIEDQQLELLPFDDINDYFDQQHEDFLQIPIENGGENNEDSDSDISTDESDIDVDL